jgi:hypothetical protein
MIRSNWELSAPGWEKREKKESKNVDSIMTNQMRSEFTENIQENLADVLCRNAIN